jgi:2,4-dienoyl-CoA reductase-like NADH-dependent reductase (Old Yellow Enzyme family)
MNNKYEKLFSPITVNKLQLHNRTLMAPIATNFAAPYGSVTERMIAYYTERAIGEVGMIIIENANIDFPLGANGAVQLRIDEDRFIPGLALLREALSDANPKTKVALQLNHPGGQTKAARTGNQQIVAPSAVLINPAGEIPRPLTAAEIQRLVNQFALGAVRAQKAGFDAVEIHGGFSYLLAQFLSPRFNQRSDQYGGCNENRARFPLAIVRAIRQLLGPNYPILFRLNADEFVEGGVSLENSRVYARLLQDASVDLLHVTAGSGFAVAKHIEPMSYQQGWKVYLAAAIKKEVDIPIAAVGSIREPQVAEDILKRGDADCLALGRTLIADPYWVAKARRGTGFNHCISCNVCAGKRLAYDTPIRCTVNPLAGNEGKEKGRYRLRPASLSILVIGAGVGGMKAALEAAQDGHKVTLAERDRALGGRGLIASTPPNKAKVAWLVQDLAREVNAAANINLQLATNVDMTYIKQLNPDYVIVAAGSDSNLPATICPLPAENIMLAEDVLRARLQPSDLVIGVVGGGSVGCECAEFLAVNNNKVTVYEMLDAVLADTDPITRGDVLLKMSEAGVNIKAGHRMMSFENNTLTCAAGNGVSKDKLDLLVLAAGSRVVPPLLAELADSPYRHDIIGDAVKPGRFVDAIRQAYIAIEKLRV